MEFNEMWSFVAILTESVHLLPRIWKIITPLAAVVIFLPSLFFLFFIYSYQILQDTIKTDGPDSAFYGCVFIYNAAEIVFYLVFVACAHLSGISTILVSAAAYTGKRLPPSDLVCRLRKLWKRPFWVAYSMWANYSLGIAMLGVFYTLVRILHLINPITICLLVALSIAFVVYVLKSSVGGALALVASVVEESSEGTIAAAAERGEKLVEGQRLKGFMLNLSINILVCVCLQLVFWVMVGYKGTLNMTIYGLFFVCFVGLSRICGSVVHTVFYFQCKKYHGEEIDYVLEQFQYTNLSAASG